MLINNVNFHELEAQKYWSFPKNYKKDSKAETRTMIFSNQYIGTRKMDGAFYKFIKDDNGNMELIGRSKGVGGDYLNKIEWVPHLHEYFESLPNGTCLLGEIVFPNNEGSSNVTTIMGCLKDKAVARQEEGDRLSYYIFDVLAFNGIPTYLNDIEKRIEFLDWLKTESYENIIIAQYLEGQALWNELQTLLCDKKEGVVITKKGTHYQPGKRPARQTLKIKKELADNIDVVIIGINPPTRLYNGKKVEDWLYWENVRTSEKFNETCYKQYSDGEPIEPITKAYYNNWAGSLMIGARKDDKVVAVGSLSGMTEEVLSNWKDYIGKVAEVGAMEILQETQGIRHPRFVQWREDLIPRDTDWYRIFGDE